MIFSVSSRLATTIAVLALAGTSARAEPPSSPIRETASATARSSDVQLASADHTHRPMTANEPASAGARKPAARVTTCRCGGQVADPSDDEAEQPQE